MGVSMFDGQQGCCSYEHCGVRKLSVKYVIRMLKNGEAKAYAQKAREELDKWIKEQEELHKDDKQ